MMLVRGAIFGRYETMRPLICREMVTIFFMRERRNRDLMNSGTWGVYMSAGFRPDSLAPSHDWMMSWPRWISMISYPPSLMTFAVLNTALIVLRPDRLIG